MAESGDHKLCIFQLLKGVTFIGSPSGFENILFFCTEQQKEIKNNPTKYI